MLRRNDKGPAVAEFQNKLLRLGCKLPRWGADGDLGNETFEALNDLFRMHGRVEDPDPHVVSDVELAFVDSLIKQLDSDHGVKPPARLIDRRKFAGRDKDYGPRPITSVRGVTLHQTACILSVSKDPARCDDVGAHYVIMRGAGGYYSDGDIIWLHDETRKIIHGNEWNTQCWGIEIDGLFAGIEGDPKTVWDNPKTPYKEKAVSLTDAQRESCLQLIEWRYYEIIRMGGKMITMSAHRQSSGTRRNDPGSKCWQEIALPLMAKLGLQDGGPGFVLAGKDGGYPIPVEWDPSRTGYKY